METVVSSVRQEVIISSCRPTTLIGERINPSGKKHLAAALETGDWEVIRHEAVAQVAAGAAILDVNVGLLEKDQSVLMPEAVRIITEAVDAPLCLDTDDVRVLEAGLRAYRGKPIVNSVKGDEVSLATVLPLVKEYGAAVIGLTMDETGIPKTADKRIAIAHRIVERAQKAGIPPEDVIIDCLALTVATDGESARITLEAIQGVHERLGVNQTLGASNISFGLPDRGLITDSFLSMAILLGVTCPTVDAAKVRPAVLAADLLLGRDEYAMRFIRAYRQREATRQQR
jgi:5-methyltetrahydrofolate--homocysteine methyltransferase